MGRVLAAVLWTPTLAAYLNVSLAGAAIATVGLLEPLGRRLPGPAVPEGWSYNPSAWSQRVPVIVLSALSFVIAAYLAAFQLGAIGGVWDPLFGDGTRRVLTSEVSRAFPVSDAALGAATYMLDLLMTCAGDKRRWRSTPWLVILFGILIIPVGIVSVVLVMLQPIVVGAWCSWCLVTAAAPLIMVPLALDEVAATIQLLRRVRRRGGSWWSVLWRGEHEGASPTPAQPRRVHGNPPWTLAVVIGAGIWTMLSPAVLDMSAAAETSAYLAGALVIVVAVTAASEVARAVRLLAIPLGAWIAIAPWLIAGSTREAAIGSLAAGLMIVLASLRRGAIGEQRATVDRLAFWPSKVSAVQSA